MMNEIGKTVGHIVAKRSLSIPISLGLVPSSQKRKVAAVSNLKSHHTG